MKEESPADVSSCFEEPHRQPTAGEVTAHILMKEHERIANRLEVEGIDSKKARDIYSICNGCAIYEKNLTDEIAGDVFGNFGRKPEGCFGIKFQPSLDKKDKLVFHSAGECKGYVNLAKYKK